MYENWKVRQAADQALAQIAEEGIPDAIAAVSARLQDGDYSVQRAAV